MPILAGYLLPHAPVFIEEIGTWQCNQVKNTIQAYQKIKDEIMTLKPDTIVVISPHGPIFTDAISLYDFTPYKGNLSAFGSTQPDVFYKKNQIFLERLAQFSDENGGYYYKVDQKLFQKFQFSPTLDHGVLVPLHFLLENESPIKVVAMSYGSLPYLELLKNGAMIQSVSDSMNERIVVIASGDMSHALKTDGPYDYNENGPWFDQLMKQNIENQNPYDIFLESANKINRASECGLRSYALMLGSLSRYELESEVLSYEGPFGVGYLVAKLTPKSQNVSNHIEADSIKRIYDRLNAQLAETKKNEHLFVQIAREVIEYYIKNRKPPTWELKEDHILLNGKTYKGNKEIKQLHQPRGTFVSIKKYGLLRGCIGTIMPTRSNALEEIITNAISACSRDYRFDSLEVNELAEITIQVDVLSPLEEIQDISKLDPHKYGVVVYSKDKKGVLLPDLEGIETVDEQLKISTNKGGFTVDEIDIIERFSVERFS